jgi:hypothetical protein
MEKTNLFQAPTEPEAPLLSKISKRGGRVIHISFDGQRQIESKAVGILKIPRGKVSYVTHNMWKYRRNFIESFGLSAT